jgi:O-antigen/teichoic acid export membrane protein
MKIASIAKNTSFFTFALIIQKIISFSFFVILASFLAPDDLGKFYLAISITTIFSIFIDLGLANVLTREIAKINTGPGNEEAHEKSDYLRSVLFIKIFLATLAVLAVVLFANLLSYPDLVKGLIYISLISMVLDSFALSFWSYVRGHHVLKYESVSVILFQATMFGFGYWFLKMGMGLKYVMASMALASIINFSYSFILLKWRFKTRLWPIYSPVLLKKIISLSLPFALFAILQKLYMYLDTVLLSSLAGDKYVGLYQIAFKIVFALQFLPMAFMASLYPAFSLYYKENQGQLTVSFERAINYLLIISVPISLGIFALSDEIIKIFRPEYIEAVWPLKIIILSLVFIFINFPIGALLNACDRQKINTRNMAIVLFVSVILNFIFIPRYQALGASLTVLLTNILMFLLGIAAALQIVQFRKMKLFLISLKIMAAGGLMFLAALYLKERVGIFINIPLSAIIYISSVYILGGFSRADIISVFKSFR